MVRATTVAEGLNRHVKRSFFRSKRRVIRYGLLSANILLLSGVALFLVISRQSSGSGQRTQTLSLTAEKEISNPLDELSGADIAVNVAQLVHLDQATAVQNNADTVNSQLDVIPNDSQVVAKPQIVETGLKSIKDLITYVTVEGDTIDAIAAKFGVNASTVRWSNDLNGNAVAAETTLTIPPVDGILYEVKSGDTLDSIASKYQADAGAITAFNDAEITGIVEGQKIVIPDGKVPAPVRFGTPNYAGFRFGGSAVYGYNGYDYGYCTWYTANRRAEVGKPIPANLGNASTWKVLSQRAGISVGNTPQQYAVIWTPPRDYYGHVGFVEQVFEDGSILVSEMNVRGWGVRSEKILSAEQAAGYSYIY